MKYAIKIEFDVDTYLYVTEDTGKCDFDLRVKLYNSLAEANKDAEIWRISGKEQNVRVVEYNPE